MKLLCTLVFFLCFYTLEAQYDPAKINKKAVQLFDLSMQQGRDGNLPEGIATLKKAVAINPGYADAYLSMAGMYTEIKNYQAAVILRSLINRFLLH